MRNLAQRSSEAAGEINDLINKTTDQISRGVSEVGDASAALADILAAIESVSEHVSGIAQSSQETASTVSEIGGAIRDLDQATQRNAAMFEESLAASQLLQSESATLLSLAQRISAKKEEPLRAAG